LDLYPKPTSGWNGFVRDSPHFILFWLSAFVEVILFLLL